MNDFFSAFFSVFHVVIRLSFGCTAFIWAMHQITIPIQTTTLASLASKEIQKNDLIIAMANQNFNINMPFVQLWNQMIDENWDQNIEKNINMFKVPLSVFKTIFEKHVQVYEARVFFDFLNWFTLLKNLVQPKKGRAQADIYFTTLIGSTAENKVFYSQWVPMTLYLGVRQWTTYSGYQEARKYSNYFQQLAMCQHRAELFDSSKPLKKNIHTPFFDFREGMFDDWIGELCFRGKKIDRTWLAKTLYSSNTDTLNIINPAFYNPQYIENTQVKKSFDAESFKSLSNFLQSCIAKHLKDLEPLMATELQKMRNTISQAFAEIEGGNVSVKMMVDASLLEVERDTKAANNLKNDDPQIVYRYLAKFFRRIMILKFKKTDEQEMIGGFYKSLNEKERTIFNTCKTTLLGVTSFLELTHLLNVEGSLFESKVQYEAINGFLNDYISAISSLSVFLDSQKHLKEAIESLLVDEYNILELLLPQLQSAVKNDFETLKDGGYQVPTSLQLRWGFASVSGVDDIIQRVRKDESKLMILFNKEIVIKNKGEVDKKVSALQYLLDLLYFKIIKNDDQFEDVVESLLKSTDKALEILYTELYKTIGQGNADGGKIEKIVEAPVLLLTGGGTEANECTDDQSTAGQSDGGGVNQTDTNRFDQSTDLNRLTETQNINTEQMPVDKIPEVQTLHEIVPEVSDENNRLSGQVKPETATINPVEPTVPPIEQSATPISPATPIEPEAQNAFLVFLNKVWNALVSSTFVQFLAGFVRGLF
ncbi:hypothetical protein IPH25_03820 [bacterium]|nr:MAG: hypothetical protein IPH25_03820 [bacterium]QQR62885.1 MAG: hypothetical protein IPH67_00125 [bacterium]